MSDSQTKRARRTKIFVVGHGQQDNIGDSVLRRAMLNALRDEGDLVVHAGSNDENFLSGLGVTEADSVVGSSRSWLAQGLAAMLRGELMAVGLNAGEAQLSARYTYHTAPAYALAIAARLTGRPVFMTGVGLKAGGRKVWLAPLRLATGGKKALVTWRDEKSRLRAGFGGQQPDWALGEGGDGVQNGARTMLAVSMRSDHRVPGRSFRDLIRGIAEAGGLDIIVVSQVERDNDAALRLAKDLGGVATLTFDDPHHARHEARVRETYAKSAVVVSDRLHSLVIGITEGAIPVALSADYPEKAARTLATAGFEDLVASGEDELEMDSIMGAVQKQVQDRSGYDDALKDARSAIVDVRRRISCAVR